jgi:hypothetical protein
MRSRKTTVAKDKHGIFVRCNGEIYRPYVPSGRNVGLIPPTRFRAAQQVRVGHAPCSPTCKITDGKVAEVWRSHGVYWTGSGPRRASDECFKPSF